MEYKKKFKNHYMMIFFVAMFGMYFARYYTHAFTFDDAYLLKAQGITVLYILMLLGFFWWILKKSTVENRMPLLLALGLLGGINFGTYVRKEMLGTVFLYLVILYLVMIWMLLQKNVAVLMGIPYLIGICLYPGFLFLALPIFLFASAKNILKKRWMAPTIIVLGVMLFVLKAAGVLGWQDGYGVLEAVGDYFNLSLSFSNLPLKIVEAVITVLLFTPCLYAGRKYLTKRKMLMLLPLLGEIVLGQHMGMFVFYVLSFGITCFLYGVLYEEEYLQKIKEFYFEIQKYPGFYILYIYPFLFTPLRLQHVCAATGWIMSYIEFLIGV